MLTLKEDFNLWTPHYNEYSFQDDCFTGTTQDGSLDTIYFRSLDRLNTTFKQHNLKIKDIQKLRVWSIISGIKV